MPSYLCQYAKDCPVFNEKVKTNGTPLPLYKNVFCNRGIKGWKNCEQYLEFNLTTVPKPKYNVGKY